MEQITCLCVAFKDCLKVCIQLAGCIGRTLIGLLASAAAEVVEGNCVNASVEQGAHLCCVLHCHQEGQARRLAKSCSGGTCLRQ